MRRHERRSSRSPQRNRATPVGTAPREAAPEPAEVTPKELAPGRAARESQPECKRAAAVSKRSLKRSLFKKHLEGSRSLVNMWGARSLVVLCKPPLQGRREKINLTKLLSMATNVQQVQDLLQGASRMEIERQLAKIAKATSWRAEDATHAREEAGQARARAKLRPRSPPQAAEAALAEADTVHSVPSGSTEKVQKRKCARAKQRPKVQAETPKKGTKNKDPDGSKAEATALAPPQQNCGAEAMESTAGGGKQQRKKKRRVAPIKEEPSGDISPTILTPPPTGPSEGTEGSAVEPAALPPQGKPTPPRAKKRAASNGIKQEKTEEEKAATDPEAREAAPEGRARGTESAQPPSSAPASPPGASQPARGRQNAVLKPAAPHPQGKSTPLRAKQEKNEEEQAAADPAAREESPEGRAPDSEPAQPPSDALASPPARGRPRAASKSRREDRWGRAKRRREEEPHNRWLENRADFPRGPHAPEAPPPKDMGAPPWHEARLPPRTNAERKRRRAWDSIREEQREQRRLSKIKSEPTSDPEDAEPRRGKRRAPVAGAAGPPNGARGAHRAPAARESPAAEMHPPWTQTPARPAARRRRQEPEQSWSTRHAW